MFPALAGQGARGALGARRGAKLTIGTRNRGPLPRLAIVEGGVEQARHDPLVILSAVADDAARVAKGQEDADNRALPGGGAGIDGSRASEGEGAVPGGGEALRLRFLAEGIGALAAHPGQAGRAADTEAGREGGDEG